jgi:hypothetical protein
MRLWFRRNKRNGDAQHPSRRQASKAKARPHDAKRSEPPARDPIKDWETPDQAFLRQAGDPFIDG